MYEKSCLTKLIDIPWKGDQEDQKEQGGRQVLVDFNEAMTREADPKG